MMRIFRRILAQLTDPVHCARCDGFGHRPWECRP